MDLWMQLFIPAWDPCFWQQKSSYILEKWGKNKNRWSFEIPCKISYKNIERYVFYSEVSWDECILGMADFQAGPCKYYWNYSFIMLLQYLMDDLTLDMRLVPQN